MNIRRTKRFTKAYHKLSREIQKKFNQKIKLFFENIRHPSLRVKKIQGTKNIWEGSIDSKYRFTFQITGNECIFRNIDNHDECLKNP